MTTQKIPRIALAPLFTLALALQMTGQPVTPPAATPPAVSDKSAATVAEDDEMVVLSPFIVSAGEDAGSYSARATLAGSRIRTELKDVGSAISVVTSQFLQDTGSKNNSDLLVYTTGTEVGGPSGNFFSKSDAGNSRNNAEGASLLQPNTSTRVRGLTAADNTRDFFLTDIPWDGYNTGRVDMQRGPNAILFGYGSPAGIINSSIDQAMFKNENKVEVRIDGEGSQRGSFSFNKVLLPNELALRVAGVDDQTKYRQRPAYNNSQRLYGAVTYTPSFLKKNGMVTSLRMNAEHGKTNSNNPRNLTPGDGITPWQTQLNFAVYNPIKSNDNSDPTGGQSQSGNANQVPWLGVYGGNYGQVTSIQVDGQQSQLRTLEYGDKAWGIGPNGLYDNGINGALYARGLGVNTFNGFALYNNALSSTNPLYNAELNSWFLIGATKDKYLSDKDVGLFDFYNKLIDGSNKHEWNNFDAYNVNLSQTFFDNRLGIEAVVDKQKYYSGQTNGANNTIYVDLSTVYTDGRPNPNVGKAFIETDDGAGEYNTDRLNLRATVFGELRFTDFLGKGLLTSILGRHVFTGMFAEDNQKLERLSFKQYVMDGIYNQAIEGPRNPDGSPYKVGSATYTKSKGIDQNERQVIVSSYISGNLSGTNLSQANLSGLPDNTRPIDTGSYYYFNSKWNKPTDPTAVGYVDPNAAWTPGPNQGTGPSTQSENPANYGGWSQNATGKVWSYADGDRSQVGYAGTRSKYKIKSQAAVWQGYFWNDDLVGMVGWRKDDYAVGTHQSNHSDGSLNEFNQLQLRNLDYVETKTVAKGESLSYSYVLHTPKFIRQHLPYGSNISLFYNRSSNFNPAPGSVDINGDVMADPVGKTKDYGVALSLLNERITLKINWFDTKVKNDRLPGFQWWQIQQWGYLTVRDAYNTKHRVVGWEASQTDGSSNVRTQAQLDAASASIYDAYDNSAVFKSFIKGWGLEDFLLNGHDTGSATQPSGVTASTDTQSKGVEYELTAQPIKNWNISLNASKTNAIRTNIGGALKTWMETVAPIANGPASVMRVWWGGDTGTLGQKFNAEEAAGYGFYKASEGVSVTELRPWRANLVTGYYFDRGVLKGANIGGAYRWEDKQVIGYKVKSGINAITGNVDTVYDLASPFYAPSENHIDLWIGYSRKITAKIDWRIQLNLKDLFAEKKLIPISTEPDGTPAAYRIPQLFSWQLTNTFTF